MNNSSSIDSLIDRVGELHSAPEVAQSLLNLTRDTDFDIREVVDCVSRDPALSARMLRVVNSSRYGLRNKVSNLQQAVALLGQRSLRLIVMSFSIVESLTSGAAKQLYSAYWQRAISIANVAWQLSKEREGEIDSNDAYTAGLLADLGMLLFAQHSANEYAETVQASETSDELVANECARYGFDHAQVSGRLLEKWGFPEPLIEAVQDHHSNMGTSPLSTAVRAGDLMADALWTPETDSVTQARSWLEQHFRFDIDRFTDLALRCKDEITLEAEMYGVHLQQPVDCDRLLGEARLQFQTTSLETALDFDSLSGVLDGPTG